MESSIFQTVFIDSIWTPHGVHVDYWELVENAAMHSFQNPWSPHRLYIESLQSPHGIHVDSL
jgi:hypothetical protein